MASKFYRGGNTRHTRNMRCMHEAPQDVLTDAYPEDEYYEDLRDESLGALTAFVRESGVYRVEGGKASDAARRALVTAPRRRAPARR